jgi:hypothetical protein
MADRGLYSVSFAKTLLTAASTDYELISVLPAAGKSVEFVALTLGSTSILGDADEELLNIAIVRGHTAAGTLGAVATPVALNPSSPAFAGTARTLDTTLATGGTGVFVYRDTFNGRAGMSVLWPPEMRPEVRNAEYMTVRLVDTLASDESFVGTLWFRES